MRLGIKPTVDIVFKRIFGSVESSRLTLGFLNDLLPLAGRPKALSVEILNPWRLADFRGDKEVAVDVRARDENGRDFQIEMQVRPDLALEARMLDNWARLYSAQIGRGGKYRQHRPVISIWILDHPFMPTPGWFHCIEARDRESGAALAGDFLIIAIELSKRAALPDFDEGTILKAGIDRWLYLLAKGAELDPGSPGLAAVSADIEEALEIMSVFTRQERARHSYEKRLDYEQSLNGMIQWERAEGMAQGMAQGERMRALEDARRLKALGVALDIIAEGTGLAREEVEEL